MSDDDNIELENDAPELPTIGDVFFDDAGEPVAITTPYDTAVEADATQDDPRSDFQEKLADFLQWLAAGGSVKQAGRKAILLAHLAGKSGCKTDKELARRLNISSGRLSQLRAEIIDDFGSLGRCNRRQN